MNRLPTTRRGQIESLKNQIAMHGNLCEIACRARDESNSFEDDDHWSAVAEDHANTGLKFSRRLAYVRGTP